MSAFHALFQEIELTLTLHIGTKLALTSSAVNSEHPRQVWWATKPKN